MIRASLIIILLAACSMTKEARNAFCEVKCAQCTELSLKCIGRKEDSKAETGEGLEP